MIPSHATQDLEDTLTPWTLMRSILFHPAKEKGHCVEMVVSSAVEHMFKETAVHANATASNHLAKANRASHGQRVEGKGKSKEIKEKSKGTSKGHKSATGSYTSKSSKIGRSGLENPKPETNSEALESAPTCPTDTSYMDNSWCDDGWSYDEWNDDWSAVGQHEGWDQTCDHSTRSPSFGSSDHGARMKMNVEAVVAVNTFPLHVGPDGAGDGRFYRTASGECIPDGRAWQFQGDHEHGLSRSLH